MPIIKLSGGGGGGSGGIRKVADAAARTALTPATGDYVVQTDTHALYYWDGTTWILVLDDSDHADLMQVISDLADHLADATDAHDASAISVTPAGNLAADDVQEALGELQGDVDALNTAVTAAQQDIDDHIADAVGAHAATAIAVIASGNLAATEAQAAFDEHQADIDALNTDVATAQQTIDDHIADPTEAHAASAITVTPAGGITSTEVQAALEELDTDLSDHIADPTAAHAASAILYDNATSGLTATDVQGAIDEVVAGAAAAAIGYAVQTPTVLNPATFVPNNVRRQLQPIAGNGGPSTFQDISDATAQAGDELVFIGTSDDDTVTVGDAPRVATNGSCTLGLDDQIYFVFYSGKWREISRRA